MTRTLLIGERFNLKGEEPTKFDAKWMSRLIDGDDYVDWMITSLRIGCYHDGFGRKRLENLGLEWTGSMNLLPAGSCGEWDATLARRIASEICVCLHERFDRFIYIGNRTATALLGRQTKILEHAEHYIIAPHPSGRSHWWNFDKHLPRAIKVVQEWMHGSS